AWALGRRSSATPALRPVFERARSGAKTAVRRLSPLAFPAVAHAALAGKSGSSELAKRLVVTLAVVRGRI
ncbi:MAG: hypothetical protein KGO51_10950, partial [Alphaproteobacteria bacterium]|nr:hypothetical protein [Alphaproteobacteria bacterium]